MAYLHYERDIVIRYGIDLEGWTYPKFVNPSDMSTSLLPLEKLYNALKEGTCKFIELTPEAKRARQQQYETSTQAPDQGTRKAGGRKRNNLHMDTNPDATASGGSRKQARVGEGSNATTGA